MSIFPFTTTHKTITADARDYIPDEPIDIVITSPPYPMIEMWDDLFTTLNPDIKQHINTNSYEAFELMHTELDKVWENCSEAVTDDGIICVNIGNATRSTDDLGFSLFPNRERIVNWFINNGFTLLPSISWNKPTNKPNSFLGSGCLPPNAYVVNDSEHILIFRKGDGRSFEPKSDRRYSSAYFWEERNDWFSGEWSDLLGVDQYKIADEVLREQSAAYPVEVPYRLLCMYSVYGDTVYDPFGGTGTTQFAGAISGRNSIGVDIDPGFQESIQDRISTGAKTVSESLSRTRLENHSEFVEENDTKYEAENYNTQVKTKAEIQIKLPVVTETTCESETLTTCTTETLQ